MANFKIDGEEVGIRNLTQYYINHQLKGYTLAWENATKGLVKELPLK